jgi:O-antigen ligase
LAIVAVPIFIAVLATALPQRQASITALLATLASVTGATLVMLSLVFIEEAEFFDVSTFIRLQLISSGVEMAARTFFLGIGVGGFETEMWIRGLVGQTYGIINPHNAIARMLAENGAIGVALYGYLLFGPILTISRAGPNSRVAAFTAAMAVSLPLLLSAGSDPMSSSSLQLAIAFVWISCRVAVELGRDAASDAPPPSKAANLKEAFS